jgi:DNA repair exonuclease SbcCD ATPase subunit
MIKELELKSFGKFRDAKFAFSPVTVFIGENESGKTTIFDAIFDNISEPKGNTARGKRLAERYGDGRESKLEFDGARIRIEQDEFLNLHAIGAGDVNLNLSAGGDWLERVKSSIFTGGIDPGMLAAEFEKLSSENGTMQHMKKIRRLESERNGAREALDSLVEKKTRILSGEKAIGARRRDLDALAARSAEIESRVREKELTLAQQEKIRERESLVRAMELIGRRSALASELKRLERYGEDRTGRLKSLAAAVEELRHANTKRDSEAEGLERQAEAAAVKTKEREQQAADLKSRAFVASQLSATIEASAPRPVIRVVTSWNGPLLAASVLPLAAGAAALVLLGMSALGAAALVGGAVIALLMVFFARKTVEREERPDTTALITRVKDEWRARTRGELTASTLEVLHREMVSVQSEYDSAERELARLRAEESSLGTECLNARKSAAAAGEELSGAQAALAGELGGLGVRDIGEYIARRGEYQSVRAEFDRNAAEIDTEVRRFGLDGVESLRAECELRAARLREEITCGKISDADINRLQKDLIALKRELKELESRLADLRSSIDKGEGEVKGSLGDLPELIYEKETAVRRLDDEIARMNLDRRAAAVTRDVFGDMARDSDAVFAELGSDISRFMDGILPAGRGVSLREFDNDSVEISDAGGAPRALSCLSTGTRDSFYLAARLALALRSRSGDGGGLIVLDEPFHSLDGTRVERALGLLKKFHEEHGWQIVLFSKESGIGVKIKEQIPGARVHELR